ncbi:MAG: hypothetical protein AAGF12_17420 [Myxococcota bacterium]
MRGLAVLLCLLGCDGTVGSVAPPPVPVPDGSPIEEEDASVPVADAMVSVADADVATPMVDGDVPDAEPAPEGQVPMFVAYGHAARTLTSCDGGETWMAEHSFEANGHDHSEYSGLGRMAYGAGKFIACAGWGTPTKIVLSENGVDWEDLPDSAFVLEDGTQERPRGGCSGIAWDGTQYAFIAGGRLFQSTDGRLWVRHPTPVPGESHIRAMSGGGGLLVYIRGGAYFSDDGGDSWFQGDGFRTACGGGAQRGGRILFDGDRVLVSGRDGVACVSENRARTFRSATIGNNIRFITPDGTGYLATSYRNELHRSPDGLAWTDLTHDANAEFAALAREPGGAYVAVSRDAQTFFRSENGTEWTRARSMGVDDDYLWTIVFGHASASAACPGE